MARKLRPSGGYRTTCSFQTATIIYDATYHLCRRFVDQRSRTVDQMIQAARSGRQNIAEGSRASATSSQTQTALRLLNVPRSSFEEMLLDYEDYLRQRGLAQWAAGAPEALAVRDVPRKWRQDRPDRPDLTDLTDQERWQLYTGWLEHDDGPVRANAVICLLHQANYLLDQQIAAAERRFVAEGGYSELLAAARLAERRRASEQADQGSPPDPARQIPPCPVCGKPMVLRTARNGRGAGRQFCGCSAYPECKGALNA